MENIKYLSTEQTMQMKGLFAIFVVLVHFSQRMSNAGPMTLFKNPGYLAVGGFFFLSGYGLYSSYLKSDKLFLKKTLIRIMQIYKPLILVTLFYLIFLNLFFRESYSIKDIVLYFFNIKQIDSITWYLLAMVYYYIIFYIAYRYFGGNKREIVLFLLSLLYFILAMLLKGKDIWWYNTAFLFFLGVIFKKKEGKIKNIFNKKEIIIFLMSLFLLACHLLIFKDNIVSQSIITIIFIFSFMVLNFKVKYNSKFFIYIGLISYEIYLIHMKIFNIIFRENMFGRIGNVDFVLFFIGTILFSIILYVIVKIRRIIKKL